MPRKAKPYDPVIGARILRLRKKGHTLKDICALEGIPARSTVYKWLENDAGFNLQMSLVIAESCASTPLTRTRARALGASATPENELEKGHAVAPVTQYNADLANIILDMLLEGQSIRSICARDDMPSRSTIFKWMNENAEFRASYELAAQFTAQLMIDEIAEIADDSKADWMDTESGPVLNKEAVARSRLRVDTRFRLAEKLFPKRFGQRVHNELTGADGGAIQVTDPQELSNIEVARRVAFLLSRGLQEPDGDGAGAGDCSGASDSER